MVLLSLLLWVLQVAFAIVWLTQHVDENVAGVPNTEYEDHVTINLT